MLLAKSARAEEYTDSTSARGSDALNECLGYGTKQSHTVALGMLVLRGMRSTPLLPVWPGPDRVLSMDQIEVYHIQTVCMLN